MLFSNLVVRDTTGWNTGVLCLVLFLFLFMLYHFDYLLLFKVLRANALHILTLLYSNLSKFANSQEEV